MNKALSIMLVDDNRIDLFIHSEIIKGLPEVSAVSQYAFAQEALKHLEENGSAAWPDVILLDIRMPVMDGFAFLAAYEKLPLAQHQTCRIIMLSSSLDEGDLKKAAANPLVSGFLGKPLQVKKLQALMQAGG